MRKPNQSPGQDEKLILLYCSLHHSHHPLFLSGYYCPEGQTVPDPNGYPCPLGYFCVAGSASPQLCPSGSYQDEMRSSVCKECPPGFYCDNALAAVVNVTMFECPEGSYIVLEATQMSREVFSGQFTPTHPLVTLITLNRGPSQRIIQDS